MHPDRGDLQDPQQRSEAGPDDDALAALYQWPHSGDLAARADLADRADGFDRALVRANMIASLDGGTTVQGRSGGLGNAADEHLFALLRDLADVVLVGAGTVRAERYGGIRLTGERVARRLRWGLPAAPPPIAVVTGRGLDPRSPLFTDTVTPPIVITTAAGARRVPGGVEIINSGTDRVDLAGALIALQQAGFRRVHCEGGPALLAALAADDLLDELCLTISPMLLGAGSAPMLPAMLTEPMRWSLLGVRVAGDHLFARYRRPGAPGEPR